MARVIVGVFPNRAAAEQAVVGLKEAGFDPQGIGTRVRSTEVAGLAGLGLPDEEAYYYNRRMQEGAALVTLDAAGRESEARRLLLRHGAEDTWSTTPWRHRGEPPATEIAMSAERPRAESDKSDESPESTTPMPPGAKPLHRTGPIIDRAQRQSVPGQPTHETDTRRPQAPSGGEAGAIGEERTGTKPGGGLDRGSVVGPGDAIQHGPVTDPFAGELQPNGPGDGHINYDDPALGQRLSPAAPSELPPERPKP